MKNQPFSLSTRSSGLLLHPTSLPSRYGIGDLGPLAYDFVNKLHRSGQSWWQIFPLGPAGYGGSPYQPTSAFAGNPLLISPDVLIEDRFIKPSDIPAFKISDPTRVAFSKVSSLKFSIFQKAYWNFEAGSLQKKAFEQFRWENRSWLEDYALYCVLKEIYKGANWTEWSGEYRRREKNALHRLKKQLASPMRYHEFLQFQFFKQWFQLKSYANKKGVGIIGDIPIFVAHDSVDVWAHPHLFYLDKTGQPEFVSGTPPDYFSKDGQRWGNPLYNWDVMRKNKYAWWVSRFQFLKKCVDAVRLDHFIGFERYWRIPAGHKTAKMGKWIPGPSDHFFKQLIKEVGPVEIIAEDLGAVNEKVKALRDRFKFPGMKILQFGFADFSPKNQFLPHNFMRNSVVYTGTHDNDTSVGWFRGKKGNDAKEKQFALDYLKSNGKEIHWDFIRAAFESVANVAIIPLQDVLGLSSVARMNRPGTARGNWTWRLQPHQIQTKQLDRLKKITEISGRFTSGKS